MFSESSSLNQHVDSQQATDRLPDIDKSGLLKKEVERLEDHHSECGEEELETRIINWIKHCRLMDSVDGSPYHDLDVKLRKQHRASQVVEHKDTHGTLTNGDHCKQSTTDHSKHQSHSHGQNKHHKLTNADHSKQHTTDHSKQHSHGDNSKHCKVNSPNKSMQSQHKDVKDSSPNRTKHQEIHSSGSPKIHQDTVKHKGHNPKQQSHKETSGSPNQHIHTDTSGSRTHKQSTTSSSQHKVANGSTNQHSQASGCPKKHTQTVGSEHLQKSGSPK